MSAITPAERRVIEEMRLGHTARRITYGTHRCREYSWFIGERPVTRPLHSLMTKGLVTVPRDDRDVAVLTEKTA